MFKTTTAYWPSGFLHVYLFVALQLLSRNPSDVYKMQRLIEFGSFASTTHCQRYVDGLRSSQYVGLFVLASVLYSPSQYCLLGLQTTEHKRSIGHIHVNVHFSCVVTLSYFDAEKWYTYECCYRCQKLQNGNKTSTIYFCMKENVHTLEDNHSHYYTIVEGARPHSLSLSLSLCLCLSLSLSVIVMLP